MSRSRCERLLISGDAAVDGVAEPTLERPPSLRGGLLLVEFALVEVPPGSAGADLADRDQVQGAVELAVAGSGEPVTALVTAGGLDGGGTAVAGVVMPAGEPSDRSGVTDDLRGQYRADAGARSRSCRSPPPQRRCRR